MLLPTPGSPPTSVTDPGTTPPPNTRPISSPTDPGNANLHRDPNPRWVISESRCGAAQKGNEHSVRNGRCTLLLLY